MKPITVWKAWDKELEAFVHNHIEDGHSHRDMPSATFATQKHWTNSKWLREHAYLDADNRVVNLDGGRG